MVEIESSVTKFKCLLASGFNASLNVEGIDGKATVVLKAYIGAVSLPVYNGIRKSRSPAYLRRKNRRRQDRLTPEKAETVEIDQFKAAEAFRTPEQGKPKDAKPVAEKAMEIKTEHEVETEDNDLCTFNYWDNSDILTIENAVKFVETSI